MITFSLRALLSVVVALHGVCIYAIPAYAQTDEAAAVADDRSVPISLEKEVPVMGDFVVSPTREFVRMNAGDERTVTLEITNRAGREAVFELDMEDFAAGDEQNPTVLFGKADGPFPARLWLQPAAMRVRLSHGERAYVPVRVSAPADADPGDHYGVVLVARVLDPNEQAEKGFNILSRVGALFLITINGPVVRQSSLMSLDSSKAFYWSYDTNLRLRVKNEGTVYTEPRGTIEIRNLIGATVDELIVKDWYVLRQSERNLHISWKPRFAFGRYTAVTKIMIDDRQTDELSTSFWIVPALPVLIVVLVIFLVSFLVQVFMTRFEIRRR